MLKKMVMDPDFRWGNFILDNPPFPSISSNHLESTCILEPFWNTKDVTMFIHLSNVSGWSNAICVSYAISQMDGCATGEIVVDMLLILMGNEQIEISQWKQPYPTGHLHLHFPIIFLSTLFGTSAQSRIVSSAGSWAESGETCNTLLLLWAFRSLQRKPQNVPQVRPNKCPYVETVALRGMRRLFWVAIWSTIR